MNQPPSWPGRLSPSARRPRHRSSAPAKKTLPTGRSYQGQVAYNTEVSRNLSWNALTIQQGQGGDAATQALTDIQTRTLKARAIADRATSLMPARSSHSCAKLREERKANAARDTALIPWFTRGRSAGLRCGTARLRQVT